MRCGSSWQIGLRVEVPLPAGWKDADLPYLWRALVQELHRAPGARAPRLVPRHEPDTAALRGATGDAGPTPPAEPSPAAEPAPAPATTGIMPVITVLASLLRNTSVNRLTFSSAGRKVEFLAAVSRPIRAVPVTTRSRARRLSAILTSPLMPSQLPRSYALRRSHH